MLDDFMEDITPTTNKHEKVLLVDYHNLAMRNLFGQAFDPTDVSFVGFRVSMLVSIRKLARDFQPNRIIFCKEAHDRNWRYDVYSDYKAGRAEARESSVVDFSAFFPINESFMNGLEACLRNCQFLKIPHLEADDLIALTVMTNPDWDITLVSTDKDFYQLHKYKNFKQWDPIKGEYITIINPEAALQEKIVRGDKSDNIPSLQKGVGSKRFAKIYSEGLMDWINKNNLQESYDRNTKLISFNCIPTEYHQIVKNALNEFKKEPFDGRAFYSFVIGNGLGAFLDKTTDFINIMKNVN
ncbi:MAG: hypothetical protein J6T10_27355 [Methanobrevibacter sp.]|nr:hypothetical protein [Methanobrevibacter sp.]